MGRGVLEVRNLRRRFAAVDVLRGVDLAVQPDELVALVGENGAGKTTLVRCIAGALAPDAGGVWVDGEHSPGASRDPETGDVTPPPANQPSAAETAATIRLRRAAFFLALDAALGLGPLDPLPEEHLVAVIAASSLPDATKRQASKARLPSSSAMVESASRIAGSAANDAHHSA